MRRIPCSVFFFLACAWSLSAGQILGTVRDSGGKPVAANTEVRVACGANPPHVTRTDQYGSYKLFVGETGRCTFTVIYNGQQLSADVFSYADPVHADFDVVRDAKGNYGLKRR